jgi:hypothetical protein
MEVLQYPQQPSAAATSNKETKKQSISSAWLSILAFANRKPQRESLILPMKMHQYSRRARDLSQASAVATMSKETKQQNISPSWLFANGELQRPSFIFPTKLPSYPRQAREFQPLTESQQSRAQAGYAPRSSPCRDRLRTSHDHAQCRRATTSARTPSIPSSRCATRRRV